MVNHVNVGAAMIREEPASQQDAAEGLLRYQIAPNVEATALWKHTYGYRPWRRGLPRHGSSFSRSHSAATPRGGRSCEADTSSTPCSRAWTCRNPPCTLEIREDTDGRVSVTLKTSTQGGDYSITQVRQQEQKEWKMEIIQCTHSPTHTHISKGQGLNVNLRLM